MRTPLLKRFTILGSALLLSRLSKTEKIHRKSVSTTFDPNGASGTGRNPA